MPTLTEQELTALISVIQRAPMLPAEILAIQGIVQKLKSEAPKAEA